MNEITSIKLPREMQGEIEKLVKNEVYETKSLLIRTAIRKLLKEEKEKPK